MPRDRTILPENNLDILRAVAVLLVLLDHTILTTGHGAEWSEVARWAGQAGVCAFFVHTSLVLMSSLERDGAPERPGWVRRFYVRRAWRIYPLAIAVICVVLLLKVPSANLPATYSPVTLPEVITNLLLVQDLAGQDHVLGVLWTLPMEVQMYVALPLCYLIARRRAVWPVAAMLLTGIAIMQLRTWGMRSMHIIPGIWRFRMFAFLPCFLLGVSAYWALRRRGASRPASPAAIPAWVWPLVIAINLVAMYLPGISARWWWAGRIGYCLVLAAAIPLVRDAADSWLTKSAHTIAVYSYGVYLLHPLALRTGFGLMRDFPRPVQWAGFIATLVASVYAAYHLVEKPGIALGRRLLDGGRARVASPTPSLEATAPPP